MASERQADVTLEGYTPWLTPKRKLIAGGIVLAVAFAAIMYVVTVEMGQFLLSVSEVHAKGPTIFGKDIRVNGIVVPGSVNFDDDRTVIFQIVDAETKSGQPLGATFRGTPPGQFDVPSVEVVLEGSLESDGLFHVTSIITRESRKYIPETDG